MKDTEIMDSLFLELSQFTSATTEKELSLKRRIEELERARIIDQRAMNKMAEENATLKQRIYELTTASGKPNLELL